jgi:hypothetical protein
MAPFDINILPGTTNTYHGTYTSPCMCPYDGTCFGSILVHVPLVHVYQSFLRYLYTHVQCRCVALHSLPLSWLPCILPKHTWFSVHMCALFQSESCDIQYSTLSHSLWRLEATSTGGPTSSWTPYGGPRGPAPPTLGPRGTSGDRHPKTSRSGG